MLSKLNNKKIYITPYNDMAVKLDNFFKKNLTIYNLLGFIDSNKIASNIIKAKELENCFYDYIIILNSSYQNEIYHSLKNISTIKAEKLLFSRAKSDKYLFSPALQQQKILCFGTCQMQHLTKILNHYLDGIKYSIKYITSYGDSFSTQEVYKNMESADIIIYQALSEKKSKTLNNKKIQELFHLKTLISIPFLKVYGIYPLEYSSGFIFGEKSILYLLDKGIKKEKIYTLFKEGLIDFDMENRFNNSFYQMNIFHPNTTIKLSNFIKNNYKNKKLFNSYSHPSNILYNEILRQLNKILNIDIALNKNDISEHLGSVSTISPYDSKKNNYASSVYYDGEWFMKGILMIDLIISRYQLSKNTETLK